MNNTINVYISGTTGESKGTEGGFAYKISYPIANTIETEEYSRGLTGNNITSTVAELYAMKYAIERIKAVNPSLMVKFNINNKSVFNIFKSIKELSNNNWIKGKKGKEIDNVTLLKDIYATINEMNLIFLYHMSDNYSDESREVKLLALQCFEDLKFSVKSH
jgi:ribonuclease HI